MTANPLLSVVVPVYNEARSIDEILRRVQVGPYPYPEKEVIVVNDGSTDGTRDLLARWEAVEGFRVIHHAGNQGKGSAVRTGLAEARGRIVIIQDADLEYDPNDYPILVEKIRDGDAVVVYGSRYLQPALRLRWTKFRLAVVLLNGLVRLLYGQKLTDEATCYKAFPRELLPALGLQSKRFELCAEMTAKFCRMGIEIVEVPISYSPRSVAEGKKIGWRDAWTTVMTFLKWRMASFHPAGEGQLVRDEFGQAPLLTCKGTGLQPFGGKPLTVAR